MILITGTIRIPTGSIETVRPAMEKMIAASRAEDGCLQYSYAMDVLDDGLIRVNECWRDQAALDAHFSAEHLKAWRSEFETLEITDRALTAHKVADSTPV